MKTIKLFVLSFSVLTTALMGCSSKSVNHQIDTKMSQETTVTTTGDLSNQAQETIETTPGLSADQRTQLISLRDKMRDQIKGLNDESIKLRSLLIQDVVSADNHGREVSAVKRRLKKVENKKLSVIFDGIDQADTILGKNTAQRQAVMDRLFDRHHFE